MKVNAISNNQYTNNSNKAKASHDKALQNIAAARALSGTDSANMTIANSLLTQANVLQQGIANANDAIGILGIADSTLSNLTQNADRLNELFVSLNNPALSQREKSMIQKEANAVKDTMKHSLSQASFNGKNVFSGELEFHTGNGLHGVNLNGNSIAGAIENLDINSQNSIQKFNETINSIRSDISSTQNAMLSNISNALKQHVALSSAESNLQNNDIALNLNDQKRETTILNAAILAQAHNTETLKSNIDRLLA